jgi:para-nitrobenzyl esterase
MKLLSNGLIALCSALTFSLSASPGLTSQTQAAPIVQTAYGPVQGVNEGALRAFFRIPYAAPPIGAHRFKPPSAPAPWNRPLAAVKFGPACPQIYSHLELPQGSPYAEDCITLNVWSPARAAKRPVIVFIHGGGFTQGTARNPWYDGANLARKGAVVVSLQYRLGPFGWLDLSDLGPDYARSMNNGLLDQMSALRWVRQNIAAFGGDAANVTVIGESAGAISISALLGAPEADGLFDRAILESGTPGSIATRQWSGDVTRAFAKAAGFERPDQILKLDTAQMLKVAKRLYEGQFSDVAFHPVVDGSLIPERPALRIASGKLPPRPVIIGTNLDEARYWYQEIDYLPRLPASFAMPWLQSLAGKDLPAVLDAYRRDRPTLTPAEIDMAIVSDVNFRMPAVRAAEAISARGGEVYMYLATVPSIALDGAMGSPHAVELPFVFGTLAAASDFVANDAPSRRLADAVQDLWISFARGQAPSAVGVQWPRYDTQHRATLMLDSNLRVQSDPYSATRKVWKALAFDGADPGLDRASPLQFKGTNTYAPAVILAVIGVERLSLGCMVIAALLATTVLLFWSRSRRHRQFQGRDTQS